MPHIHERDAFWEMKEKGEAYKQPEHYEEIHMPKNSAAGMVYCRFRNGILVCAMIWHIWWMAIVGFAGIVISWIVKSLLTRTCSTYQSVKLKSWKTSILTRFLKRG